MTEYKVHVLETDKTSQTFVAKGSDSLSLDLVTNGYLIVTQWSKVLYKQRLDRIKSAYIVTQHGRMIVYKRNWK